MKLLVAIANHGQGNRQYLDAIVETWRSMPHDVDIVALSNIPKDLGPHVEVRVGVPSENPRSLPFAHRELFAERRGDYDAFVYSEDDTLARPQQIDAFFDAQAKLNPDEIAGFVRYEESPDGTRTVSTIHSFFRWLPHTVVQRGGEWFAQHSNPHSAFFIVTQDQLGRAIDSGGFLVQPHEGRLHMLESAATDIYTQCGLTRLLPIDRLLDVLLHHMPNKYLGKMGVTLDELDTQVEALHAVRRGELPSDTLIRVEPDLPKAVHAKHVHRPPLTEVTETLAGAKRVLSIGAGAGELEAPLLADGADVTVVPVDAVLGRCCERRGMEVVHGPLDRLTDALGEGAFDAVLMESVLHLVENPADVLAVARVVLRDGGFVVATTPNTTSLRSRREAAREPAARIRSFHESATHPASGRWLRHQLTDAGLRVAAVRHVPLGNASRLATLLAKHRPSLANGLVLATARK